MLPAPPVAVQGTVLSSGALGLLAQLERRFGQRRRELLEGRRERLAALDAGARLIFLPATEEVRRSDWRVQPAPPDLTDRRVEITGPVDRKMIINALNSGANAFMADFEDATSPTWSNLIEGQVNLIDAVRRTIEFTNTGNGKLYRLSENTATLMVRPRGWHMTESHALLDGQPISASLFDAGLFLYHNARELVSRGSGPYLYLPKLESHLEARLWSEVLSFIEDHLGLTRGTVRVTFLIETLPAAFEMDEILFELREHVTGLNCGRWDYIFSFIKQHRARADAILPDRGSVGMDRRFLNSYSQLLIQTCHRRGAHAMGGMAAQIPIKDDPEANAQAFAKVLADKQREASNGHDGTWVAHPGLIGCAREAFDAVMTGPNQLERLRSDVSVSAQDLLALPQGSITEAGLRQNLNVGVRYLSAWLCGNGCVPIDGLMEDAATAEISRTQLWQWRRHGAQLEDGRRIDADLFATTLDSELDALRARIGDENFGQQRYPLAADLFRRLVLSDELADFLTLEAYPEL